MKPVQFVRSVVRWYLSPSGMLLFAGLSLLAISTVSGTEWIGVTGIAILGVFFPYRMMRERRQTNDRLTSVLDGRLIPVHKKLAPNAETLSNDVGVSHHAFEIVNRRLDDLDRRLKQLEDS